MIVFFRQLWGELVKMSARKRTYIGFGAFFGVEAALVWLLSRPKARAHFERLLEGGGFGFDAYWSMLSVAFLIMALTVFVLGGNFLALVVGDIVAKETEEGSFRLLLSRPVSRTRILVLKFLAGMLYTLALIVFIGATSLLAGLLNRGAGGGLFVWAPEEGVFEILSFSTGMARYALSLPMLALSTLTVSSIAFMFSCFKIKPATATILTVSIMVVDMILQRLPFAASYRDYALATHMAVYVKVYLQPIPWAEILRGYAFLAGIDASCFIIGWFAFQSRDFKS
jgi:ABC-2 type transport system permease protein